MPGKSDHDVGDLCLHNSSCSEACGSPLARSASEKNGLRSKMVCAAQRACLKNATSWLNHSRWYASMATNAAGTNWSPLADRRVHLHPERLMSMRSREIFRPFYDSGVHFGGCALSSTACPSGPNGQALLGSLGRACAMHTREQPLQDCHTVSNSVGGSFQYRMHLAAHQF